MISKIFDVVWQTISERSDKEKKRHVWTAVKWVLRIAVLVWKVLKFFFHDGW